MLLGGKLDRYQKILVDLNAPPSTHFADGGKFVNRNYAWFGLGTRPESDMKKSHGGKNM